MDNGESPPVCDAAFLDQVAYTRRRVERWIFFTGKHELTKFNVVAASRYEAVFGRGFVSTGGLRTTEVFQLMFKVDNSKINNFPLPCRS